MRTCYLALLTILSAVSACGQPQLIPEPAITAILSAFDKYDVVAMPVDHGLKDLDDLILTLVRHPEFSKRVNDIEVECGNSLYQDLLDRYTSGADVNFRDVQRVWRNTTQPPCGLSAFYEQLVPLVRTINRKLPKGKGIRILAGDPPFDWDRIKSSQDMQKALPSVHRDRNIASVLEQEVLAKHRKALMLMGTFHLLHNTAASAVSLYETNYPNRTLVISEFGTFDTSRFATWPVPSLARIKGAWMGKLDLGKFLPPPMLIDPECVVHNEFPKNLQKPVEDLFDAVLYLGSHDLLLWEKLPADIALDAEYMQERSRRERLPGSQSAANPVSNSLDPLIFERAANPVYGIEVKPLDPAQIEQVVRECRERKPPAR